MWKIKKTIPQLYLVSYLSNAIKELSNRMETMECIIMESKNPILPNQRKLCHITVSLKCR